MPNGRDTEPVSYGRWQEAHAALEQRVTALEQQASGAAENPAHARLAGRLAAAEEDIGELRADLDTYTTTGAAALARRRDRQWTLLIALLAGLALPLMVAAVIALTSAHLTLH